MKMFKKLKIRLVLINMLIFSAIFAGIFTGIILLMQKSYEMQAFSMMNRIIENDGKLPRLKPPPPKIIFNPATTNHMQFLNRFAVQVNNNGNVLNFSFEVPFSEFNIHEEDIAQKVREILKNNKNFSTVSIGGIDFRYLKTNTDYGYLIAFLDRSPEIRMFHTLIFVSLIIGGISLAIMFLLSFYFAGKELKPIHATWEKQRQFISDASHELRTPLAVMNTNMDLVLSNSEETVESQSKWLQYIKSEIGRMTSLVSDLLYLAQYDTNENIQNMHKFDLSSCISNVMLSFEYIVFEEGKTLKSNIEKSIYYTGDEVRLKQLAIILIDNAVKYCNPGGKITIRLKKIEGSIQFSVNNTGEGIPAEHMDKIFERFYRIDKARSKKTGGHGLGLSIAKSIVEQHHGKIQVKSNPGDKTEFIVIL
jgi:two-component system sensor histidine kinase CiaH